MIKAILIFNNHGKPRLIRFYQYFVSIFFFFFDFATKTLAFPHSKGWTWMISVLLPKHEPLSALQNMTNTASKHKLPPDFSLLEHFLFYIWLVHAFECSFLMQFFFITCNWTPLTLFPSSSSSCPWSYLFFC